MKLGIALPQSMPPYGPEILARVAQRAEALGYHSLWIGERVVYPIHPQSPYPGTPDGSLPEFFLNMGDGLDLLTFVAAHTKTIRLGTSVIVAPLHNPVLLGRRLATIDQLSNGRLIVGLGVGWSKDEFDTAGVPFAQRGARMEEFLQVLNAVWTQDTVEYHGRYYQVPAAKIGPKPVQKPRPPIYLAAFAPKAMDRLVRFADGWNPAGISSVEQLGTIIQLLQSKAKEAGRRPEEIQVVLRSFPQIKSQSRAPAERGLLNGAIDEIAGDVRRLEAIGVSEIFYDLNYSLLHAGPDRWLDALAQLRKTV